MKKLSNLIVLMLTVLLPSMANASSAKMLSLAETFLSERLNINTINGEIVARGLFLVDVFVGRDNDIEVTIESEQGVVELDDCVAVSRFFETCFDREKEDYSLTVTSAGLDQPFKVLKQCVAHPLTTQGLDRFLEDWEKVKEA